MMLNPDLRGGLPPIQMGRGRHKVLMQNRDIIQRLLGGKSRSSSLSRNLNPRLNRRLNRRLLPRHIQDVCSDQFARTGTSMRRVSPMWIGRKIGPEPRRIGPKLRLKRVCVP